MVTSRTNHQINSKLPCDFAKYLVFLSCLDSTKTSQGIEVIDVQLFVKEMTKDNFELLTTDSTAKSLIMLNLQV